MVYDVYHLLCTYSEKNHIKYKNHFDDLLLHSTVYACISAISLPCETVQLYCCMITIIDGLGFG